MFSFDSETLKHFFTSIKNKFSTIEEMNNKVVKVDGKDLSTNNFSDEDVANINISYDDVELKSPTTLTFYATSVDGTKSEIKTIDLDI